MHDSLIFSISNTSSSIMQSSATAFELEANRNKRQNNRQKMSKSERRYFIYIIKYLSTNYFEKHLIVVNRANE